jgi:hypothetical protein
VYSNIQEGMPGTLRHLLDTVHLVTAESACDITPRPTKRLDHIVYGIKCDLLGAQG